MRKTDPVDYLKIGIQYLTLVRDTTQQIASHGNKAYLVSDTPITDEEFFHAIHWTDFHFVLPLLFNFYHGIEVILKGLLLLKTSVQNSHALTKLLATFAIEFPNERLHAVFSRYILRDQLPELISNFLSSSSTTVDKYYEALKYPEGIDGTEFKHKDLMHKGTKGADFYIDITADIEEIKKETVRLWKQLTSPPTGLSR